jgi:hypothetical protein
MSLRTWDGESTRQQLDEQGGVGRLASIEPEDNPDDFDAPPEYDTVVFSEEP